MDKQKLLDLFDEVLKNWKNAENYVIQETSIGEEDYNHEDLEKEIKEFKEKFIEALND